MLILKNITFARNKKMIFENVSASTEKGDLIIIAGKNGSGKTTLLKNIVGLLRPVSGEVIPSNALSKLSYVMDDGGTIPLLTVEEHLHLQSQLQNVPKADIHPAVEQLISLFNLGEHKNHRADELSAGLRKKLGIAVALNKNAEIFLFDEPFNSLDIQASTLLVCIFKLLKKNNRTVIIVTHSPALLTDICDQLWELQNGQLTVFKKADDIIRMIEKNTESVDLSNLSSLPWN